MVMSRDVWEVSKSLANNCSRLESKARSCACPPGDFKGLLAGRFFRESSRLHRGRVFLLGLWAVSMRPGSLQAMP